MMEEHVVDFMSSWGVGIGMLGDQGAESIGTVFNQLGHTYANITNGVAKLKSVVTEHHRQVCPANAACCVPRAKRRKKSDKNS